MSDDVRRVILIGFSGSGKSTVARLLATRLGWSLIDMDERLEERFGMTIPEVFASHGEPTFRAAEREELQHAAVQDHVVVATGGGAVVDPAVWAPDLLGRPGTLVVALDAQPATMLHRLRRQHEAEGARVERPLLAGSDPLPRIQELKARRQEAYDRAAITLIVDAVSAEEVTTEVISLIADASDRLQPSLRLRAESGHSDIFIASGIMTHLGELTCARWPSSRRAWLITDHNVGPHYGERAATSLRHAGFDVALRAVPPGEASKSLAIASELYDWLLVGGIERGDVVIALGGGVVGDLAGFVAATVLRGVGLVQVPTSLLAMVDSSVGGKTGLNHPTGKNQIGAFYQPPLVLIDPTLLQTLPPRELAGGWAEVIKHAVIQPSTPGGERGDLLTFLERNAGHLVCLDEPATTYAIRRNVAVKAAVVEADEREAGLRSFLNFGHTLGHAIEAAGYRYLHGEAIAVGMRAAMHIAVTMGMIGEAQAARLDRLIERFALPTTAEFDPDLVMRLLTSDKKRVAGRQRWVLPRSEGGVRLRDDVPDEVVREALITVQG